MTYYIVSESMTFADQLISDKHFGVNLVSIYDEEFVDPENELSENVQKLGATTLRFPGGSATEYYFDMTQPDLVVSSRDPRQKLTPMDDFFEQAGVIGVDAAIVIPTQTAFELSAAEAMLAGSYGARSTVTQTYLDNVATFVGAAIDDAATNGVEISGFEVGNEFWGSGEMTAGEYGRVAGQVVALLDDLLDGFGASRPEIVVQTTSSASRLYSSRDQVEAYIGVIDGETRAFSQNDIDNDFGGVVPTGWQVVTVDGQGAARSQVSQIAAGINAVVGAADAVDGLVQHYYISGGFDDVDGAKAFKFSQFQRLEDQLDRSPGSAELSYHITEWNTNAKGAQHNRGLQHASMMIEGFFELAANDVDVAQIWPLSFDAAQGISLVDLDGDDLAISGEMFRLMSESLPDSMPVLDWSVAGVIDIHGFARSDGHVFFISERSGSKQSEVTLDLSQFITGPLYFMTSTQLWDGGVGGDDATAEPVLTDRAGTLSTSAELTFDLDSWANLRIEVTYVGEGDDDLTGRNGSDFIESFGGADVISAGAGDDTIDGGAGYDTAMFDGTLSSHSVIYDAGTGIDAGLTIVSPSGDRDQLMNVEVLDFSDETLATDRVLAYLERTYGTFDESSDPPLEVSLREIVNAPDPTVPSQVQMEVGRTWIEQPDADFWQSVSFSQDIVNPSVVMGPASSQGGQPFTVRVRNVTETGFEFQLDEWDYLDGYHKQLEISWLAGTEGQHLLGDGSLVSFGSTSTSSLDRTMVALEGFETTPIVLGQLGGDAETAAITHRIDDVTAASFDFLVQVEQASQALRHDISETPLYYVALDIEEDSFIFAHGSSSTNHIYNSIDAILTPEKSFFADMQSIARLDPGVLRYEMAKDGDIALKFQEEKSYDWEKYHVKEDVSWLFIDQGVFEFA